MAVRALLHYALEVPDQTVGEKFYTSFGLVDEARRDGTVALRPAPLKRESVLLYGGPKKRLHHLAFGAPGDDFAATRESIRRAGVREVDAPRGAPEGGLWVRDPDGNLVNVRDEAGTSPPADPPLRLNSPGRIGRQVDRGAPPSTATATPRRLGHVLLFTPDVERQLDFYTRSSPPRARASTTARSRWAAWTRSPWARCGCRSAASSPAGAWAAM